MIEFDLPQFRSLLRISMEVWKLLMLMAFVIFSAFILIWYHERPYGIFLSSNLGKNVFNSETDRGSNSTVELVGANRSSINSTASGVSPTGSPPSNERNFSDCFNGSSKTKLDGQPDVVVSISDMNEMLRKSRFSYEFENPKWPSQVDEELLNTRKLIEGARIVEPSPSVHVDVYRNYSEFVRSYELMENTLKIYIYAEGERPVFHKPKLFGKYASEGWFMKHLQENKHFVTTNSSEAHLFYLPFSTKLLEKNLYVRNSNSEENLVEYLRLYLENITAKYRFWNRTGGADHFLVAYHDWAPYETSVIMKSCIRALCNTNAINREFIFGKDISLPVTKIRNTSNPLQGLGGKPPSEKSILAFFAGKTNGYLRPILLSYWGDKDPDIKIFGKLRYERGR